MKMKNTQQMKVLIKKRAEDIGVDPRVLLRVYMMERFLDRVSRSSYAESFVLKGGMLISYLIGVNLRTTQDIDTTINNVPFSRKQVSAFLNEVIEIVLDDGVRFEVIGIDEIMETHDYPGLRVSMVARFEQTRTLVKIDISTGHVIYPAVVNRKLDAMFSAPISMMTYPIETVVAEKLHTILDRGTLNTRMRDFYDLWALGQAQPPSSLAETLPVAFNETFKHRSAEHLIQNAQVLFKQLLNDPAMTEHWKRYAENNRWASSLTYSEVLEALQAWLDYLSESYRG